MDSLDRIPLPVVFAACGFTAVYTLSGLVAWLKAKKLASTLQKRAGTRCRTTRHAIVRRTDRAARSCQAGLVPWQEPDRTRAHAAVRG